MPENPPSPSQSPVCVPRPEPVAGPPTAVPELAPAACASRLAALFPAVFTPSAPRPLKLRIQTDVQQRAPGIFTKKSLSIFLHRHTTSTAYLKALVSAPQRLDLDGMPAGDVLDEHRQAATAELERRRASHDARRGAERDAQRAAHDVARRARAADDELRRDRDALIRAYETTTLTRSNFCALKGLSETELDALLAKAQQSPRAQPSDARPAERAVRPTPAKGPRR